MIKKLRVLLIVTLFILLSGGSVTAYASDTDSEDTFLDLETSMQDILDNIDISELEQFLDILSSQGFSFFGSGSVEDKVEGIISGDIALDYSSFVSYILSVIGLEVLAYLPTMISILAIAIAMSVVSSLRSNGSSKSVVSIVEFSSVALTVIILSANLMAILTGAKDLIQNIQTQVQVVFPIMLTLMSASGGVTSSAVYQPAVAILGFGIMELIVSIILPLFILSCVFTIVGNLSGTVKLKKLSSFFMTACKWLLGTTFFLFIAFLSVQGITASIYDGVSIRTAKFAISKYVPIIGGYLSEGFNLVMAGSVLVKNAVGMTSVLILILSVLPTIASIVIFNLSLQFTSAIIEPLGDKRISNILSQIAKNMSTLIAVLLGAIFLYFIFLVLIICTGNLVL